VISRIVSAFRSAVSSKTSSKTSPKASHRRPVEPLESRTLFAIAAATSIITDNRGETQITFNAALDPTTVKSSTVQIHTAGADGAFGTADDVKIDGIVRLKTGNRRIWWRPRVPVPFAAGTTFSVKVSSKSVKSATGERIDGEFNGPGIQTGNGVAGGDLLLLSKRDKGTVPVARFSTVLGNIDVNLDTVNTPVTYANFLHYANGGLWDYTNFHRSESNFVIQGGGFNASLTDNTATGLTEIPTAAAIVNEHHTPNTRGTIAMAKTLSPNSATDQWFFNESDTNTFLDDPSNPNNTGGFTVFGTIKNASGLAVMDQIAALTIKDMTTINNPDGNIAGAMNHTPVVNPSTTPATLAPLTDLAIVRRIAILNKVVAFPL
jgi:peptidyl-prolyl cis-trans isomerase A (cyclophilin A)/peptidyl-prolyl cis-trans isomerase B (cyclophilin B)